jgi:hypothetical protein
MNTDYNDPTLSPLDFMIAVMRAKNLPIAIPVYAADGASPYISERVRLIMEAEIRKKVSIIPGAPLPLIVIYHLI